MTTDLTVLEAKRYGIFGCQKNQSLYEAALKMVEEDISALVVVDPDGFLAGIISRTDLMRALIESQDWQTKTVAEYMNVDVVTVSPQHTIGEVARLLLERQIHRVVVVRELQGQLRPISVISAADIVYHMTKGD